MEVQHSFQWSILVNRRTFIEGGLAVVSLAALGGCTEESLDAAESQPPLFEGLYDEESVDLPVRQKFRVVADGVESAAGAEIETVEDLEAHLETGEIDVEFLLEHVEEGERILSLEYVHERIEEGLAYRFGIVAGGYASLVASGYDGDKLEATLVTATGEQFGHYEILTGWARRYNDGELTAREYGRLALDELESA